MQAKKTIAFALLTVALLLSGQTIQNLKIQCAKNMRENGKGAHFRLPIPVTEKTDEFTCEAILRPPAQLVDHGLRCMLILSRNPLEAAAGKEDSFSAGLEFYRGVSKHSTLLIKGKSFRKDSWKRLPYGTCVQVKLNYKKSEKRLTATFLVNGQKDTEQEYKLDQEKFRWEIFSIVSMSNKHENLMDTCEVNSIKVNGQEILPSEFKENFQTRVEKEKEQIFQKWLAEEGQRGVPVQGVPLFNTLDWDNFPHTNFSYAKFSIVPAEDRKFPTALRMEGLKPPQAFHTVQIASRRNEQPIKKGDIIYLRFDARCLASSDESGDGSIGILAVVDDSTWHSLGGVNGSFNRQWRTIYGYCIAKSDYPKGKVRLQLYLSPRQQTVEIGGITALNLSSGIDPHQLPANKLEYEERPSAEWKKKAERRIEKIRKGDFVLRIVDNSGKPVPDAPIHIRQEKHSYGFGCYTDAGMISANGKDAERFRKEFKRLFNRVVIPMFWGPGNKENNQWGWENPRCRRDYLAIAAWCKKNGIQTQGHVLVWPTTLYAPPDVRELLTSPEKLQTRILEHIADITNASRGLVDEWQVINETLGTPMFGRIVGMRGMAEWFRKTADCVPEVPLIVNDNGILSRYSDQHGKYETLIRALQQEGAKIGGIGFQGHIGSMLPGPERIWKIFDRFGKFNLPIHITEFTVQVGDDEELQAEYTRDFLAACFSHPASASVTNWGFWEGKHYDRRCALYRKDWSPKLNGKVYEELVLKKWRTENSGHTQTDGTYHIRGYFGEYSGTVERNGEKKSFQFRIEKNGKNYLTLHF